MLELDLASPARWTSRSTPNRGATRRRRCAGPLSRCARWPGSCAARAIGVGDAGERLLHQAAYSLQANAKTLEGNQHPDRDAQFRHIHDTAALFPAAGDPVVSVDAKKKENVGQFKNGGRE